MGEFYSLFCATLDKELDQVTWTYYTNRFVLATVKNKTNNDEITRFIPNLIENFGKVWYNIISYTAW